MKFEEEINKYVFQGRKNWQKEFHWFPSSLLKFWEPNFTTKKIDNLIEKLGSQKNLMYSINLLRLESIEHFVFLYPFLEILEKEKQFYTKYENNLLTNINNSYLSIEQKEFINLSYFRRVFHEYNNQNGEKRIFLEYFSMIYLLLGILNIETNNLNYEKNFVNFKSLAKNNLHLFINDEGSSNDPNKFLIEIEKTINNMLIHYKNSKKNINNSKGFLIKHSNYMPLFFGSSTQIIVLFKFQNTKKIFAKISIWFLQVTPYLTIALFPQVDEILYYFLINNSFIFEKLFLLSTFFIEENIISFSSKKFIKIDLDSLLVKRDFEKLSDELLNNDFFSIEKVTLRDFKSLVFNK